jgi:hypothetical protein
LQGKTVQTQTDKNPYALSKCRHARINQAHARIQTTYTRIGNGVVIAWCVCINTKKKRFLKEMDKGKKTKKTPMLLRNAGALA